MFYSWAQRENAIRLFSGIDIALWDLAGKILNQPVPTLLGGNFRDTLKLYSHCPHQGNFMSRDDWRTRVQMLKDDPRGFTAYKVDINDPLQTRVSQDSTTISPAQVRDVKLCYELAREFFGETDIIVHCHNELDTDERMTRFWITLPQAVDLVLHALDNMEGGEIFIPKIPSMHVTDLAEAIAPGVPRDVIGIRPGEKLHEMLITADEARHTIDAGEVYLVMPEHPWWDEMGPSAVGKAVDDDFQYASNTNDEWLSIDDLRTVLAA